MNDFEASPGLLKTQEINIIGRKSWLVYLGTTITYGVIFGVIFGVQQLDMVNAPLNYTYAFFGVLFIYRLAVNRSYKIYVNDEGIWYGAGIFPWAKQGNGIRWGDADMALYYNNLLSWITNSYTITVAHKYTNDSDFLVTNIWSGRTTVQQIADLQRSKLNP
ncbi:MAG: hypothetical protein ACJ0BH_04560 [Candidatus Puniceispirillaceae bacterium]|jgi:hypothetical protein